jgi:hypothetical protein
MSRKIFSGNAVPKRSQIELPQLPKKLANFYSFAQNVSSDAKLADRVGVKPSTFSGWVNRTKGESGAYVTPDALDRLANLLSEEIAGISPDQARVLWCGSYLAFARALLEAMQPRLKEVLNANPNHLHLRHQVFDPSELGMIADDPELPPDAIEISADCRLSFLIDCRIGMTLGMLVEDRSGWRLPVPGKFHGGEITSSQERIPKAGAPLLKFAEPYGLHRFVFLEVPDAAALASLAKARSISSIDRSDINSLAITLAELKGKWRWADVFVEVTAS